MDEYLQNLSQSGKEMIIVFESDLNPPFFKLVVPLTKLLQLNKPLMSQKNKQKTPNGFILFMINFRSGYKEECQCSNCLPKNENAPTDISCRKRIDLENLTRIGAREWQRQPNCIKRYFELLADVAQSIQDAKFKSEISHIKFNLKKQKQKNKKTATKKSSNHKHVIIDPYRETSTNCGKFPCSFNQHEFSQTKFMPIQTSSYLYSSTLMQNVPQSFILQSQDLKFPCPLTQQENLFICNSDLIDSQYLSIASNFFLAETPMDQTLSL
ncbi:hypothetical protein G9A89_010423 [Geosiphon pyriformis]|nr:hypothetical protein G9A89_010423 [Geosiphon pyriformis]